MSVGRFIVGGVGETLLILAVSRMESNYKKREGTGTADRRTVLKLLRAGMVASGANTSVVSAEEHTINAEIEGPL